MESNELTAVIAAAQPCGALRFDLDDAQAAADEWGANCGPGALAAVLGLTLDAVRPALARVGFDRKRYTSPTMMWAALEQLAPGRWRRVAEHPLLWPDFGLCRVQWSGPWLRPGVPARVAYAHTHWIAARIAPAARGGLEIFDINCICAGGWVPLAEWTGEVVPWLLNAVEPKADGNWHLTHVAEVRP